MIPHDDWFSFVFWEKLKTPKRHFEINWPLHIGILEHCNSQKSLTSIWTPNIHLIITIDHKTLNQPLCNALESHSENNMCKLTVTKYGKKPGIDNSQAKGKILIRSFKGQTITLFEDYAFKKKLRRSGFPHITRVSCSILIRPNAFCIFQFLNVGKN